MRGAQLDVVFVALMMKCFASPFVIKGGQISCSRQIDATMHTYSSALRRGKQQVGWPKVGFYN